MGYLIVGVLLVVVIVLAAAHFFRALFPHPRLKNLTSEVSLPFAGKIWSSQQSFFPQEPPNDDVINRQRQVFQQIEESAKKNNLKNVAKDKPVLYLGKQLIFKKVEGGKKILKL